MEQLSRQERYEARKREKLEAQEAKQRLRRQNGLLFLAAILIPVLILVGLIGYIIMHGKAASTSKITDIVGQAFPIQGREHIAVGAHHIAYNSDPPTSGPHYNTPANWGIYSTELPQEQLVHNLEHGGIVIQYKPDLSKDIVAQIADLKISNYECKLVIAPYSKLDKNIAFTAWGRLYKTDNFDVSIAKNFIQKYRDQGPEFVPCDVQAAPMQQAK